MYKGIIGKYRFELDSETNRIMVYKEGDGVEPIAYISVKLGISEKSFHYEIMSWVADNGNL
jgi:hypothetical protein